MKGDGIINRKDDYGEIEDESIRKTANKYNKSTITNVRIQLIFYTKRL